MSKFVKVRLTLLLISGSEELKIDGKAAARRGFCHLREPSFGSGLKNNAH